MVTACPQPGNDASAFSHNELLKWRSDLFRRFREHTQRVRTGLAARGFSDADVPASACSPCIVAFAGKQQFRLLFNSPPKSCVCCARQAALICARVL